MQSNYVNASFMKMDSFTFTFVGKIKMYKNTILALNLSVNKSMDTNKNNFSKYLDHVYCKKLLFNLHATSQLCVAFAGIRSEITMTVDGLSINIDRLEMRMHPS